MMRVSVLVVTIDGIAAVGWANCSLSFFQGASGMYTAS
jgi:hypothetical protein